MKKEAKVKPLNSTCTYLLIN